MSQVLFWPGSLLLPTFLVFLSRNVSEECSCQQGSAKGKIEPLITRLWDCSQIFPGEDAERKRRELYMNFISSPRWISISGGQGWAWVLSRGMLCAYLFGVMKDCSQKFSEQQFLVFITTKLLKWWFLCVFEIMWAPSALKLHLHPRVPVHVQWPSGFMESSLWGSLINVSDLNWSNTSERVDVLIFLLSVKLALTLCITAAPHLVTRSFHFLKV